MDLRELPDTLDARHPWETARAAFFGRLLRQHFAGTGPVRGLDVGAGDGFAAGEILKALPGGSSIDCYDANYSPELISRLRARAPAVRFTSVRPEGRFDLIVLLDVIEHVARDDRFLADLVRDSLAERGTVLVSVPAHMALFTRHDVALGHHRRYGAAALEAVLAEAGLRAITSGGLFHVLLLPRAASKLWELARGIRSAPSPDAAPLHAATELGSWQGGRVLTRAVLGALAVDNACSRLLAALGRQLPGLSQWALAERTAAHDA